VCNVDKYFHGKDIIFAKQKKNIFLSLGLCLSKNTTMSSGSVYSVRMNDCA
jgi:hypothetical protein